MTSRRNVLLGMTALMAGCAKAPEAVAATGYKTELFSIGYEGPWGMTFLPDGRLLLTERQGKLKLIAADGQSHVEISGVPEVQFYGQGGLLDVEIDPDFATTPWVYLSFSEPGENGEGGTAVVRGKLSGDALTETQVIWRQTPKVRGENHWGSRLVFDRTGNLFVTTGDRGNFSELAQKLDNTIGKTIRIRPDGSIPEDNPFVNTPGALPEIWSYGHRNMQGAFLHPETGDLWTMEHGPRGGDEVNLDLPGRNYGWPVITYGINYNGTKVGEGITEHEGMEQPKHMWNPSIAPSNMIYYTGELFPQWKGRVFVGAMAHKYLGKLTLDGNTVVSEEKLLSEEGERVRDVAQGPDGAIYVFFDSDYARILRLVPA